MKKWIIFIGLAVLLISRIGYAKETSWTDTIKLKGDFRYRHESIDEEGKEVRTRHRLRARLGLEATVNADTSLTFQLASGSSSSPTSTTQTLDDSFSSKSVWIDLAYFDWQPREKLHINGGKMKNLFYIPGGLVWDGDLRPEGLAVNYSITFNSLELFAKAGYFWVEERKEESDSIIAGGQTGMKFSFYEDKWVMLGVGYFDYSNTKGFDPFLSTDPNDPKDFGNSLSPDGKYAHDYNEMEIFINSQSRISGVPVSVFGNYVQNISSDVKDDTGWLVGFSVGHCKKLYSSSFSYNYRYLEKDAVIGAFTDSDCAGGGADVKGHKFGLKFQAAEHILTGLTYSLGKRAIDNGINYNRLQIDVNFKF